jgi:uncharacterized protein YqgC (DUF456 family)
MYRKKYVFQACSDHQAPFIVGALINGHGIQLHDLSKSLGVHHMNGDKLANHGTRTHGATIGKFIRVANS